MSAFKNRATADYRSTEDQAVRNELIAAKIPVLELPARLDGEVKTQYIGLLNGFVFNRGWRYWICTGDVPLRNGLEIFEIMSHLGVRAEGHAGNQKPTGYSPELEQAQNAAYETMRKAGYATEVIVSRLEKIHADTSWPRFVSCYHIDAPEGLEAFANYLKTNRIYAHNCPEGSFGAAQSLQNLQISGRE